MGRFFTGIYFRTDPNHAKENGSAENSHLQTASSFGCHKFVAVIDLFNFLYCIRKSQNLYRAQSFIFI